MRQLDPARGSGSSPDGRRFVLYLEGPGDRSILRAWSARLLPGVGTRLLRASVILGGRQPARALEHFRRLERETSGARALCILDRDDGGDEPAASAGLEFFTWSRRHIESYLLVPGALRRVLRAGDEEGRVERVLREHLPPADDEEAHRAVDAKRLLAATGPLARSLGREIPLARIARATREHELHADVHALFARLRRALGIVEPERLER